MWRKTSTEGESLGIINLNRPGFFPYVAKCGRRITSLGWAKVLDARRWRRGDRAGVVREDKRLLLEVILSKGMSKQLEGRHSWRYSEPASFLSDGLRQQLRGGAFTSPLFTVAGIEGVGASSPAASSMAYLQQGRAPFLDGEAAYGAVEVTTALPVGF